VLELVDARLLIEVDRAVAEAVAAALTPLAVYLLVSGSGDVAVDALWLWRRLQGAHRGAPATGEGKLLAIFIPLWKEADVIGPMLDHNVASIRYPDYHIFVGVYPNDAETLEAARRAAARHHRVQVAETPHDGPTSKADCLNWIYQSMRQFEITRGVRFDAAILHDAEDLIHAGELGIFAAELERAGMAQLPVLPLKTRWWEFTHGVYCDDFAESQGKDLETRVACGAFLPGCGVGTMFSRSVLERLAEENQNRIFDPGCLTEDYDTGLRVRLLGVRQRFVPLSFDAAGPVATREYFPRRLGAAVRQRARWVTGNALQAWERHGWGRGWMDRWFLWRDRKGLWGNPISLVCNVLLCYGGLTMVASGMLGVDWALGRQVVASPALGALLWINSALLAARLGARIYSVARIYGWAFAALAPLRLVWGNGLNSMASVRAVFTWLSCRLQGRPLRWAKTDHLYPSRSALNAAKRPLGELVASLGYGDRERVAEVLSGIGNGVDPAARLLEEGVLGEEELYHALSIQQSLPLARLDPLSLPLRILRALPEEVLRRWHVLPFAVGEGHLDVAAPVVPSDEMQAAIERHTRLRIRFHLITPSGYVAAARMIPPAD
jgi:adsorption protein B